MDFSPTGILLNTLPVVPAALKTLLFGLVGRSPNAECQDLLTEITCILLRPALSTPAPLLESQRQSRRDYGIWGRMWVAKYSIPSLPERGELRDVVWRSIQELGDEKDVKSLRMPEVEDVEVEWTGYRANVSMWEKRPEISEREQYLRMMEEVEEDSPVILYFHGGAFCLMDPSTHRSTTNALAQQTHGRVVSVRYRLAPQNPFPAALLDALSSYLALIAPPPGAFHSPIPASRIVLAGDSSGAGLAASLLLLLLHLSRSPTTSLSFHFQTLTLEKNFIPAGMALTSPWLDITRSLPSIHSNASTDIVAPPPVDPWTLSQPYPAFPPDSIWPACPPRVETYCDAAMVAHPLVSPLCASSTLWEGAGPVWMCVGWEGVQDEAEVVARRMGEGGVVVRFDGFEGMPHCFSSMFSWARASRVAFERWGLFCREVVRGEVRVGRAEWMGREGVRVVEVGKMGMACEQGSVEGEGRMRRRKVNLDDNLVERLVGLQKEWRVSLEGKLREVKEYKD